MSQLLSDDKSAVNIEDRSGKKVDDIFKGLKTEEDDDFLDLTTPIKKQAEKPAEKETKPEEGDKDEGEDDKDKEEVEEIDELTELEEELEEPDEEKLELTEPIRRREILAKYPNFFKDFPQAEKSIYREREYTKIFPTIPEAKAAAESTGIIERFSEDMIEKGNVKTVLKMIKDNNPDTFARVADDYLEHLAEIDEPAYRHVLGNVIKNVIIGMVKEAKASGKDDLRIAAGLINEFAFGSVQFVPPQKLAKNGSGDKSKDNEISEREKKFMERQLDTATSDIDSRVKNSIRAAIEGRIDPNGSMTDYVKKTAIKDALDKVMSLIEKDSRFSKIKDRYMEDMVKNNFNKDSQDKVKQAYLAKAKSLVMPVLKSIRQEALRGMGRKVKDEDIDNTDKNEKPERQKTERRLSSDKPKAKLDTLKGTSSFERLNELMGD